MKNMGAGIEWQRQFITTKQWFADRQHSLLFPFHQEERTSLHVSDF